MATEKPRTYSASFRSLELRTWELDLRYPWSVTDSATGQVIAHGEAVDKETAMVAAAEAARADWGSVKWHRGS
ncbi:MAG: hypothetical protein JO323_03295 [Acidobacteriia bacterium]|nr:hypothetical protein [Terriglobia bacterium]